jgi:hypothetical protein
VRPVTVNLGLLDWTAPAWAWLAMAGALLVIAAATAWGIWQLAAGARSRRAEADLLAGELDAAESLSEPRTDELEPVPWDDDPRDDDPRGYWCGWDSQCEEETEAWRWWREGSRFGREPVCAVHRDYISERHARELWLRANAPHLFADDWLEQAEADFAAWAADMAAERAEDCQLEGIPV